MKLIVIKPVLVEVYSEFIYYIYVYIYNILFALELRLPISVVLRVENSCEY